MQTTEPATSNGGSPDNAGHLRFVGGSPFLPCSDVPIVATVGTISGCRKPVPVRLRPCTRSSFDLAFLALGSLLSGTSRDKSAAMRMRMNSRHCRVRLNHGISHACNCPASVLDADARGSSCGANRYENSYCFFTSGKERSSDSDKFTLSPASRSTLSALMSTTFEPIPSNRPISTWTD